MNIPTPHDLTIVVVQGLRPARRGTLRRDARAYLLERNWASEALDAIGL
jgi:hypothetical protein